MKGKVKIQVIILAVLLVLFIVLEILSPKETDWSKTFRKSDKIPYGTYALYSILPDIFPGCKLTTFKYSYFESLKDNTYDHSAIIIITEKFDPDSFDFRCLEKFVVRGNQVMIAAYSFGHQLHKKYRITTFRKISLFPGHHEDSINSNFTNPKLHTDSGFLYKPDADFTFFDSFSYKSGTVLGKRSKSQADLLMIPEGKGSWILSTSPHAFTNYYMVFRKMAGYPAGILSYIRPTANRIIWDEYFKPLKAMESSPLRYILNREPLRYAYYLLIFTLFIYILVKAKRRQRPIPVIKSLPNTSREFIETVGRFYYSHKGHRDIALKKFSYFLDYVRSWYYLDTSVDEQELGSRISQKSGIEEDKIHRIFYTARLIRDSKKISKEMLVGFNQMIEEFYLKSRM